ncbi:MAG: FAD-binding oxidoreductase, partial [Vicinamibacterales bacterium]
MLTPTFIDSLQSIVGPDHIRTDDDARASYGTDALKKGKPADVVVFPGTAREVAAIARLCNEHRVPLVPRGAGSGYTGGAVPLRGGVV